MSVDASDRRLIQNEATQRLENSRVKRQLKTILGPTAKIMFVCECSDLDCRDRIALTSQEFDDFHAKAKQFVVKPHHETATTEKIVSKTNDYYIVEKHDEPLTLSSDYRS